MSVSEHPVALSIEQRVGGTASLLATVMALPLLDGLFVALLLAGTLETTVGMVETGLLVFGGSATVAVILAEMDDEPRKLLRSILLIGAVLIPLAALQAAIAPMLASVLDLVIFERFAGVVILAIAAKTASSKVSEYLPRASIIILLGLIGSLQPAALEISVVLDGELMARAAVTAAIGVAFAMVVAAAAPTLRGAVDIDRFRFGSSVALGVFALPILGVLNTEAPIALAVLVVAAVLAYSPDGSSALGSETTSPGDPGGKSVDDGGTDSPKAPESVGTTEAAGEAGSDRRSTDEYGSPGDETSRAPWL